MTMLINVGYTEYDGGTITLKSYYSCGGVFFSRYIDYILWDQGGELRQERELAKRGNN